jgi:opacity protein-like surface antigen
MKKTIFILLLLMQILLVNAQLKPDFGFIAGTDYYMGDINPEKLLYSPQYMFGPILRFNIDSRHSIRLHAIYAHLTGSDNDFDYVITKRNNNVSFSASLLNLATQFEYNFFSYKTGTNKGNISPYMFGGFGYSLIMSSSINNSGSEANNHLTIPFGIGVKFNITDRLSSGLEWSYNKSFTDQLDGVISPLGETKLYNNDWYSFIGLFITYKFFNFAGNCPVYD